MGRRVLIPLLLFTLALGSFAAMPVAADASTFQDPGGAFGFMLPNGWQPDPPGAGVSFTNTMYGSTLMISSSPANGVSLNDQIQQVLPAYAQLPGYEADPSGVSDLTLGGQPAKAFAFHSNDLVDGKPRSSGLLAVVNKDTTYVLYFETARDNEKTLDPDVMTIVLSWQFT